MASHSQEWGLEEGTFHGLLGNLQLDFFLTFLHCIVNSKEFPSPPHNRFIPKKAAG